MKKTPFKDHFIPVKMHINEAQQATDERDQPMDEIHEWMSLYCRVAVACPGRQATAA